MVVGLIFVLAVAAMPSITTFGPGFLVSSDWRPNPLEVPDIGPDGICEDRGRRNRHQPVPPSFGALPVIYGTAVSSVVALALAVPLSFGAALFLVRIAPRWLAGPLSFLIEFLAAIPSIAYGLWGLFVLAPLLADYIEPGIKTVLGHVPGFHWMFTETVTIAGHQVERELPLAGRDMLCGGIVLGIMILPIITAISRDVLSSVPRIQIEGTLALGATWWQSSREMLRYSRSRLVRRGDARPGPRRRRDHGRHHGHRQQRPDPSLAPGTRPDHVQPPGQRVRRGQLPHTPFAALAEVAAHPAGDVVVVQRGGPLAAGKVAPRASRPSRARSDHRAMEQDLIPQFEIRKQRKFFSRTPYGAPSASRPPNPAPRPGRAQEQGGDCPLSRVPRAPADSAPPALGSPAA